MPHESTDQKDPSNWTDPPDTLTVFTHEGEDNEENLDVNDLNMTTNQNSRTECKASDPMNTSLLDRHEDSGFSSVERSEIEVVSPRPTVNGALGPMQMGGSRVPVSMVGAGPQHAGASPMSLMMYSPEARQHHAAAAAAVAAAFQPPPAHMGIPRHPIFPIPAQYHPQMFGPNYAQIQWHSQLYTMSCSTFRGPYPHSMPVSSAGLSNLSRFSNPSGFLPHSIIPHPASLPPNSAIVTPGPKQTVSSIPSSHSPHNTQRLQSYSNSSRNDVNNDVNGDTNKKQRKATHIKKPLNAFMLYMKEMRAKVVAECTLKESAAINQILGRRWHALDRAEQSKYYELARKERQLHMKLYPGWTARDNYTTLGKKKKKKKDKSADGNNLKKCRARYGLNQQESWCKPCRRKKKCIRYTDGFENNESEDNLGSAAGSIGEPKTPDSFIDSDQETIKSCSTDLNSLASPSTVPIKFETPSSSSSSSSASSRSVNSILNPSDINHPLSVSQLTQSHHSSSSHNGLNPLSPTLSSISLPSPMTDPPSVTSAPPIVSVT